MGGYIARRAMKPSAGGSGSVISAEVKRKQKPKTGGNKTVAHSTSCQRKCQKEGGVWFPPTSYGSWAGKLESVHPIARQVGTGFKWLHTHSCVQVLKTPLPQEGAAFQKCKVTLLQSIQRQPGPAHHRAKAVSAVEEHQSPSEDTGRPGSGWGWVGGRWGAGRGGV